MTEQNIRYSTSHLHELVAEIERRVFDGFRIDHRSAFAARRQGSAYVVWFVPTREVLDFDGSEEAYMQINDSLVESLQEENQQLTIQQKWEISDEVDAEFDKLLEQSKPLPKELLDRMEELRDKAEANREKDNGIFDRLVESIQSAQESPESCVSTIVEVDREQVKVYSKIELEAMEWSEFKKLIDASGIRGRRRANLTRDYLIYQEESLK